MRDSTTAWLIASTDAGSTHYYGGNGLWYGDPSAALLFPTAAAAQLRCMALDDSFPLKVVEFHRMYAV